MVATRREEDSVQFSLEALRRLELERVREETLEAERLAAERQREEREVARLEAERTRAEQQRVEQEAREERLRLEAEKLRLESEERQRRLELEARLEEQRIVASMRAAEGDASALDEKPKSRWLSAVILAAAIGAQVFTLHLLNQQRSTNAIITAELEASNERVNDLQARLHKAIAAREHALARSSRANEAAAPSKPARPDAKKTKSPRHPPIRRHITKPSPKKSPVVLDCDINSPLGCARR